MRPFALLLCVVPLIFGSAQADYKTGTDEKDYRITDPVTGDECRSQCKSGEKQVDDPAGIKEGFSLFGEAKYWTSASRDGSIFRFANGSEVPDLEAKPWTGCVFANANSHPEYYVRRKCSVIQLPVLCIKEVVEQQQGGCAGTTETGPDGTTQYSFKALSADPIEYKAATEACESNGNGYLPNIFSAEMLQALNDEKVAAWGEGSSNVQVWTGLTWGGAIGVGRGGGGVPPCFGVSCNFQPFMYWRDNQDNKVDFNEVGSVFRSAFMEVGLANVVDEDSIKSFSPFTSHRVVCQYTCA